MVAPGVRAPSCPIARLEAVARDWCSPCSRLGLGSRSKCFRAKTPSGSKKARRTRRSRRNWKRCRTRARRALDETGILDRTGILERAGIRDDVFRSPSDRRCSLRRQPPIRVHASSAIWSARPGSSCISDCGQGSPRARDRSVSRTGRRRRVRRDVAGRDVPWPARWPPAVASRSKLPTSVCRCTRRPAPVSSCRCASETVRAASSFESSRRRDFKAKDVESCVARIKPVSRCASRRCALAASIRFEPWFDVARETSARSPRTFSSRRARARSRAQRTVGRRQAGAGAGSISGNAPEQPSGARVRHRVGRREVRAAQLPAERARRNARSRRRRSTLRCLAGRRRARGVGGDDALDRDLPARIVATTRIGLAAARESGRLRDDLAARLDR